MKQHSRGTDLKSRIFEDSERSERLDGRVENLRISFEVGIKRRIDPKTMANLELLLEISNRDSNEYHASPDAKPIMVCVSEEAKRSRRRREYGAQRVDAAIKGRLDRKLRVGGLLRNAISRFLPCAE